MAAINNGKVVLGGIVAGIVMTIGEYVFNEFVVADSSMEMYDRLGLTPPGGREIAIFIAVTFAVMILTIWLYAMLRDRCGAGPKTAACAAAFVWFLYQLAPGIFMTVLGMFPASLLVTGALWGLVEMIVATMAGAYFYSD